jgi:probable rRNA maturation factor
LCLAQVAPLHSSLRACWPQLQAQSIVDISFVSDAEMARLNGEYRGRPRPTDVLSFALWETTDVWPQSGELALGDIIIAVETAAQQAAEHGHEAADEVAFLAVHGALHLLGYDHDTDAHRRLMWKWQNQLLDELKSSRRKTTGHRRASAPVSPPSSIP